MRRILKCIDDILDDKYFIISRRFLFEDAYLYLFVEQFFIKEILNNKDLITIEIEDSIESYYLNLENYEIFKILIYEEIIKLYKSVEEIFPKYYIDEHLNTKTINIYEIKDIYVILDYIQERSIYLDLKELINGGL